MIRNSTLVALGVGLILKRYLAVSNIALVFLMAVLVSSSMGSTR